MDEFAIDHFWLSTVVAESFYTCSKKIRLFTVYWRMVLAYDRC
jgi:hypothetical protein